MISLLDAEKTCDLRIDLDQTSFCIADIFSNHRLRTEVSLDDKIHLQYILMESWQDVVRVLTFLGSLSEIESTIYLEGQVLPMTPPDYHKVMNTLVYQNNPSFDSGAPLPALGFYYSRVDRSFVGHIRFL